MSYNYTTFVAALANRMAIINVNSPAFQTELPNIIDWAEQRCYRKLDLIDTRIVDTTGALTGGSRSFTLPSSVGIFVVTEQLNVITPFGATLGSGGIRNPLTPVSIDSLDAMWPAESSGLTPSIPEFLAKVTSQTIIVGPPPDANYGMEVRGTVRPAPLSASNPTTLLTTNLPDLFFAAAMEAGAAYQKNFGAQADDPKMAMSWHATFEDLAATALAEEFRKKYGGSAWTAIQQPPEAQPPRN